MCLGNFSYDLLILLSDPPTRMLSSVIVVADAVCVMQVRLLALKLELAQLTFLSVVALYVCVLCFFFFAFVDAFASASIEGMLTAWSVRFLARHGIARPHLGGTPLLRIASVVLVDKVRHVIYTSSPFQYSYRGPPSPPWHAAHASPIGEDPAWQKATISFARPHFGHSPRKADGDIIFSAQVAWGCAHCSYVLYGMVYKWSNQSALVSTN